MVRSFLTALSALALCALPVQAQDTTPEEEPTPKAEQSQKAEPPMTIKRMGQILTALDENAETDGRNWKIKVNDVPLLIITDPANDRMRAFSPVRPAEDISAEDMTRMMQANFDAALDARYAIANGMLWAVFIHPLSPLEKDQFISGLGQVINLQKSYGTLYSGGAMQFGSGDSGALQRQLIDELLKKGEEI